MVDENKSRGGKPAKIQSCVPGQLIVTEKALENTPVAATTIADHPDRAWLADAAISEEVQRQVSWPQKAYKASL
jgi:hypothetical protein